MKKLIAVLLVVFASFSLFADDIPYVWYDQMLLALNNCCNWDSGDVTWAMNENDILVRITDKQTTECKIEKLDEKTIRVILEFDERGDSLSYRINEFYFRFNLTSDEIENDRLVFMERAGQIFSQNGELWTTSNRYTGALFEFNTINCYFDETVWPDRDKSIIRLPQKSYYDSLKYFYDFVDNSAENNLLLSHFIHHNHIFFQNP